jgi:hypothetical protein
VAAIQWFLSGRDFWPKLRDRESNRRASQVAARALGGVQRLVQDLGGEFQILEAESCPWTE